MDSDPGKIGPFTFTVFTPTYNRAHTLPRVFDSLSAQTFRDFEWLIVDDGSNDNTAELVTEWAKTATFPIRYWKQINAGKHVAFNRGVERAHGDFFLGIDSDDWCVPESLERFKALWDGIPESERGHFSAVTVLCKSPEGVIAGDPFPRDITDSNSLEMRYRYRSRADHWGFHRTEVLRQFPFPDDPSMRFVPESIVWRAIARKYQTRYVNEALLIVMTDGGGRLTQAQAKNVAPGKALHYGGVLNDDIDWLFVAPLDIAWGAAQFARFSWHSGAGLGVQFKKVRGLRSKAIWFAMLPLGFAQYQRDRLQASRSVAVATATAS